MEGQVMALCLFERDTGRHVDHFFFGAGEMSMPGYLESVERSYEGTKWIPVRVYCAKPDLTIAVAVNLQKLDGSTESAVSLLTGISREEIAELGGISD